MQLKIEVLKMLESHRDTDISGQQLAEHFGVSRNAIWKAINALKAEGYQIRAGQNRGYRLADNNDMLSAVGIADAIKHRTKGLSIYLHRTVDSTNDEAKRLLAEGKKGPALIVAEGQTAGRGRQGKSFYSPERQGVYMTFSFPTALPLTAAVSVTTAAAVAVFLAIRDLTGIETEIKWVNDIYLGGKKICGILTEAISNFETGRAEHIILGIGLNCSVSEFPPELSEIAASLNPKGVIRNQLVARILDRLFEVISNLGDDTYLALYRKHSMVIGRDIEYIRDGVRHLARAIDIDEDGALMVEDADGVRNTLSSGEITVRPKN